MFGRRIVGEGMSVALEMKMCVDAFGFGREGDRPAPSKQVAVAEQAFVFLSAGTRALQETGSGTLIRFCSKAASASRPIRIESQPWIVCRPITIAAPAIAPAAAAVAPFT